MLRRLKKLRLLISLIALILVISLNSSCVVPQQIAPTTQYIQIPPFPRLEECPVDPGISGVVTQNRTIELTISEATKLREYIQALRHCAHVNIILLKAHIEKLENRITAAR